jgi:uncharacterized membrane protein YfcA
LTERDLVDAEGVHYRYVFDLRLGIVLSIFVGYVSSLLGVGGGFIHVPALAHLLNFPVHIATATSHFVLAVMALTGTLVHVVQGVFLHGVRRTAVLAVGVLVGAKPERVVIEPHRRKSNHSRTCHCTGVRRYSTYLFRILKPPRVLT